MLSLILQPGYYNIRLSNTPQTTRKGKKTKHAHKNMEINGNTTNKHKLETA
jgi:hypothetical protein